MGAYTYGAVNNRPHGLKEVAFIHGGKLQYTYDANGALISEVAVDSTGAVITDRGRQETYTSYGMLQSVSSPQVSLSFAYGPDHQRVKQVAPSATTIYLHPDNSGGLAYEKDIKADGSIEHRHFITAGGSVFALVKQTTTSAGTTVKTLYMHRDHLGSTTAITDEQGNVIERLAYEPFGKRRYPAGNTDDGGNIVGVNTDRGFTNHEHLDELGLIHMNGRVYDPALGRFMSADPNIQSPYDTQSYNRYTYVINNPLAYTDPTGYFSLGHLLSSAVKAATSFAVAWNFPTRSTVRSAIVAQFNSMAAQPGQSQIDGYVMTHQWAYSVGQIFVGAVTSVCGGCGAAIWSSYYTYQTTGSVGGALRAGGITYGTAMAFNWAGGQGTASSFERYAAHALVGCASAAASGGNCGNGALAAVVGKYATNATSGSDWNDFSRGVAASIAGGTASMIGGGEFWNGARTAAFGYLFNELAHAEFKRMRPDVKPYLDDEFYPKVQKFFGLLEDQGINPTVTDAFRTPSDQQNRLQTSNFGPAQVGTSLHEAGFAIDINWGSYNSSQRSLILDAARDAGLSWGGAFKKYDPVHFYYDPGNRSTLIPAAQQQYRVLNGR
jgi:RHS repeat-associated protein